MTGTQRKMNIGRRLLTGVIVAAAAGGILLSLFVPEYYFGYRDARMLEAVNERHRSPAPGGLDPEAEDMYMVQAIREIYDEASEGKLAMGYREYTNRTIRTFFEQIANMEAAGILDASEIESLGQPDRAWIMTTEYTTIPLSTIGSYYSRVESVENGELIVDEMALSQYYLEERTKKLLFFMMYFPTSETLKKSMMNNGNSTPTTGSSRSTASTAPAQESVRPDWETARRYVSYLGLDLLDDWTESDVGLVSEKAKLTVLCYRQEDFLILFVCPTGKQNTKNIEYWPMYAQTYFNSLFYYEG